MTLPLKIPSRICCWRILEKFTLIMSVASASYRVSDSVTYMIFSVTRVLRRLALTVPDTHSDIDRNAVISRLGVTGEDSLCAEAVRLFVELYGAETGNLALKSLATGGIFIGGGIGPKILPAMQDGNFMHAFKAKGRFFPLLDKIPVKLSLNPRTPLIGAINYFDL